MHNPRFSGVRPTISRIVPVNPGYSNNKCPLTPGLYLSIKITTIHIFQRSLRLMDPVARATIRFVFLSPFSACCQLAQSRETQTGLYLAASFNQLATESCAYFSVSARMGRSRGRPNSGVSRNFRICLRHTPRDDGKKNVKIYFKNFLKRARFDLRLGEGGQPFVGRRVPRGAHNSQYLNSNGKGDSRHGEKIPAGINTCQAGAVNSLFPMEWEKRRRRCFIRGGAALLSLDGNRAIAYTSFFAGCGILRATVSRIGSPGGPCWFLGCFSPFETLGGVRNNGASLFLDR